MSIYEKPEAEWTEEEHQVAEQAWALWLVRGGSLQECLREVLG